VATTRNHSTKLKYSRQLDNITQPSDVRMENELHYAKQSKLEAQMTIFEVWH
jgi:hypothetical protein